VSNTLLADGCRIGKGTVIENSVIGLRCIVGENVTIRNSIVMGADFWDSTMPLTNGALPKVPLGIGDNCVIDGVIVDKNCRMGAGCRLINDGGVVEYDSECGSVLVRDGIPVVIKDSTLPEGWVLKCVS